MERLTKRGKFGNTYFPCENCPIDRGECFKKFSSCEKVLADRLAAYEDAEEAGLLIKLPCKVGDTLYAPTRRIISEFVVTKFEYEGIDSYGHGLWVCWYLANGIAGELRMDGTDARYIGKTVFLTREEAEASLEKEGHNG